MRIGVTPKARAKLNKMVKAGASAKQISKKLNIKLEVIQRFMPAVGNEEVAQPAPVPAAVPPAAVPPAAVPPAPAAAAVPPATPAVDTRSPQQKAADTKAANKAAAAAAAAG